MVADFYRMAPEGIFYVRKFLPAFLLRELGCVLEWSVGFGDKGSNIYVKLYFCLGIDLEYKVHNLFLFAGT